MTDYTDLKDRAVEAHSENIESRQDDYLSRYFLYPWDMSLEILCLECYRKAKDDRTYQAILSGLGGFPLATIMRWIDSHDERYHADDRLAWHS